MRIVSSSSASARREAARQFVERFSPSTELIVIAATRGAADDFVRSLARRRSTFGLHRFSLTELAARAASFDAARAGYVAGTVMNAEAVAARAAFDAAAAGDLAYFHPVVAMPGFPKALARTIHELRLAAAGGSALRAAGPGARDLGTLLDRIERELASAGVNDRAALFSMAAGAWRQGLRWAGYPVLMLDVPLDSVAERGFAEAIIARAADALATCPAEDEALETTRRVFPKEGVTVDDAGDDAPMHTDLGRLRRFIFKQDPPPEMPRAGDVRLYSAPGEAREALEIARRALDEAARGVRFDEMAVCLRAPQQYLGLLEHAFNRAEVPAYFDRGTRRPDPAGRAFVALLSCACERLSARRFDEYLSLGQVPRIDERASPPPIAIPDDDAYARFEGAATTQDGDEAVDAPSPLDSDDDAIVAGTLRAPWKWEELIVESAVIGGVDRADGKQRWRRRLNGLAEDYQLRVEELIREEAESARIARYTRDLRNLKHLRDFALPLIDTLADWPDEANWGDWLDRFSALAPLVLSRPARVLRILAELRPMASVGPVPLEEARDVLQDRLLTLEQQAPDDRYGRVFVGTPHQMRGRAFRVVFVPGLAERVFPQRVREDPLLPDDARRETSDELVTRRDRTAAERLLLRLAIGAATERLYLSYPRLGAEMGDLRPRVPSFYALDVMRAITGRVPDHRTLASEAAAEAGASLAWPAPRDPARAVDDFEHDLAVLKPLLDTHDPASVKGQARYLLELNEALRRSVISRWARGRGRWSTSDGLIQVSPGTSSALKGNRLGNRPYSLSALQRFATCPYQFLLAAIHRIEPWEEPQPVIRMDPLTRGSLFHRAQAEFFRALEAGGRLPVTTENLGRAIETLHEVIDEVAADYAERLAPAIDRVWRDEIDEIRRDLGIWVQRLPDDAGWIPEYFEFSFGLGVGAPRGRSVLDTRAHGGTSVSASGSLEPLRGANAPSNRGGGGVPAAIEKGGAPRGVMNDDLRDPRSLRDPVTVDGRFILRGSVDLIERRRNDGALRVTDHKTGRNRSNRDLIIDGGKVLQPVLYSVAIEKGLGERVVEGRLYYCTTAGGFTDHTIKIDDYTRAQGLQALVIIDRAVELGCLPAAPAKDACRWCDFRLVCGPDEERRVAVKPDALIADLLALRGVR